MIIIEITEKTIFAYMDYTFMIFDRNKLICLSDEVGHAWAGGKSIKDPKKAPIDIIKRGTCYHNAIMMKLIEIADKKQQTPED